MPRFDANLTMLFGEVDFPERFRAARDAGFRAVEYMFPYEWDIGMQADRLAEHGLSIQLHNLPPGDWAAGERGIACLPDRVGEFQDSVGRAIEVATALGCPRVNCLAGVAPEGADPEILEETLVENLRFAAPKFEEAGILLMAEAINTRDVPGFFLNTSAQALGLFDRVGHPNLKLQYDVYHMQIMEGDLAPTIEANLGRIGHFQIADTPGRHEPGSGEINYAFLFRFLDRIGWDGWVGCEYHPAGDTAEGLVWRETLAGDG